MDTSFYCFGALSVFFMISTLIIAFVFDRTKDDDKAESLGWLMLAGVLGFIVTIHLTFGG